MGNGTLGNGTFQNVSGEMGHFYYLGNGTFYALGEGTLYSLGNGTFLSSGNDFILWESGHLSSGNRTTYPLGFGTSSGKRDMGNGTLYPLGIGPLILWETGNSILWESGKGESVFNRLYIYLVSSLYPVALKMNHFTLILYP